MGFISAAYTDIGKTRKVNQDAFCLMTASAGVRSAALAVLCDGMGGLTNGELASAFVVNAFSAWFKSELPSTLAKGDGMKEIQMSWQSLIQDQNGKMIEYGKQNGRMGTTLSALLVLDNEFLIAQVGDSRIYKIGKELRQITKDQSYVAQEVERRHMTAEQARTHPRRNEILQSVGVSDPLRPVYSHGSVLRGEVFLACSDGFFHEISDEEMFGIFAPTVLTGESVMKSYLRDMVELAKKRGESDNITAILVKNI